MTLRQLLFVLITSIAASLPIGTATAQRGGNLDLNRPEVPVDLTCWINDACGGYSSYGRGA